MSLSLARPALRQVSIRSAAARSVRFVHIENKIGTNMPFDYSKKGPFAIKLVLFLATGFSIPFITAAYQLKRHGAT